MTEPFHRTPAFRSKLRSLQMMGHTIQQQVGLYTRGDEYDS